MQGSVEVRNMSGSADCKAGFIRVSSQTRKSKQSPGQAGSETLATRLYMVFRPLIIRRKTICRE